MNEFCPLASGSKGNCILIGNEKTKMLVDAGISAKQIVQRLSEINVDIGQIDAILITHEHSDHIQGLATIANRYSIPVLANSETAKAICEIADEWPKFKIFSTGEPFEFGGIEVRSFNVSHDAVNPVAFTFDMGGQKVGVCADLGTVTTTVLAYLQACRVIYLEANHEPEMVLKSARPQVYKTRVLGRFGHLSNQETARIVKEIAHPGLLHVYLAHLSSECNTPELALKAVTEVKTALEHPFEISIAWQDTVSQKILF